MNIEELSHLLVLVSIVILGGKIGGAIAARFNFPEVVGELFMGFFLGATGIGRLFPEFLTFLTPAQGPVYIGLQVFLKIGILLFLVLAGSEIKFKYLKKQAGRSFTIGAFSFLLPFLFGIAFSYTGIFGSNLSMVTILFIGTALTVSALPVLARTLMELKIYNTPLSNLIIGAAMLDDLGAWTIFTVISEADPSHSSQWHALGLSLLKLTALLAVVFTAKHLLDSKWSIKKTQELKAENAFALAVPCLALVLFLETKEVMHANFGAFLFGILISGTPLLSKHSGAILHAIVSGFFAPLFFTSVGLTVVLQQDFYIGQALLITAAAFLSKLSAGYIGSRVAGLDHLSSKTISWAVNSRGAMEILLASLALHKGIIDRPLFVSFVLMAMVTTAYSGAMMKKFHSKRAFDVQL